MANVKIINLFSRIDRLEERVDENVRKITNIYDDINNNIYPRIEEINFNLTEKISPNIETIASNIDVLHNNIIAIHNNLQTDIIPAIQDAKTQSLNAMEEAKSSAYKAGLAQNAADTAAELSQDIFNTFKNVSNGVQIDIENIVHKEQQLMNTIKVETENVKLAFIDFGTRLELETKEISDDTTMLVKQLLDAVNEISVPLERTVYHAKRIKKPSVLKLSQIASSIGHAIAAFSYLTWKGYGGQDSVLREELEAFDQISGAFRRLGGDFEDFGILIRYSAQILSNQISSSSINIKIAFAEFMTSFENLFINMGYAMKGTEADSAELLARKQELDAEKEAQFIAWKMEALEEQRASDYAFLQEMGIACAMEQEELKKLSDGRKAAKEEYDEKLRTLEFVRVRIKNIKEVLPLDYELYV